MFITTSPEAMLLRPRDAAAFLGISTRMLWDLGARGKIPVVRIGKRCTRYDRRDLETFLQGHKGQ